jgi:acyl carrier protein
MTTVSRPEDVAAILTAFVRENFMYARPDAPLAGDARLLEHGIIDSMGIVEIMEFLQTRFGVAVRDDEITEENLGTIDAITRYVLARSDGR